MSLCDLRVSKHFLRCYTLQFAETGTERFLLEPRSSWCWPAYPGPEEAGSGTGGTAYTLNNLEIAISDTGCELGPIGDYTPVDLGI